MKKFSKIAVVLVLVMVLVMAMASVAYCSEPTTVEQVSGAFANAGSDLTGVLVAIAAIAIPVMLVFVGFKYGKRVFSSLSK